MKKGRHLDRSSGRSDLGEEYPHSDQIQIVLLLLFIAGWVMDSLVLKFSTRLADVVPLTLRLLIAGVFVACGLLLIARSHRLVLDDVRDEPVLVDSGVYSLVRHPMYFGILLVYLGLLSSTLSIVSFGLWMGIFLIYDRMATYEERDLIHILGADYVEYQRRVPKWIPVKLSTKTR